MVNTLHSRHRRKSIAQREILWLLHPEQLCWKSQSFLMYLRNTIYSASAHIKSLAQSNSNLPPLAERSYREPDPHESLLPQPAAWLVISHNINLNYSNITLSAVPHCIAPCTLYFTTIRTLYYTALRSAFPSLRHRIIIFFFFSFLFFSFSCSCMMV